MDGKYLLDTNVVIALFAGDASVQKHLEQADEVFLSSVVLGELYYGAENSAHSESNIGRVDEFAASNALIACDAETARSYGSIKAQLKRMGRPIPENDIWVGATAIQHSLILVSRDSHFDGIEGLSLESW